MTLTKVRLKNYHKRNIGQASSAIIRSYPAFPFALNHVASQVT